MCVQDSEEVTEEMENLGGFASGNDEDCKTWPLHSQMEFSPAAQNEIWEKDAILDHVPLGNSFPVRIRKWDIFYLISLLFCIFF